MASDPNQSLQNGAKNAGQKAINASSQAVGTGAKYLVRALTGGASTAVDSMIPWKWVGAIILGLMGFFVFVVVMIFMSTDTQGTTTASSPSTSGGYYNAGPLTCGMIPSQLITYAKSAGQYYGIPWEWSLAIARQESDFGLYDPPTTDEGNGLTALSTDGLNMQAIRGELSSTGALGTTQFLASSWSGSNAPGISEFGTGVSYPEVLSGVRWQENPTVIQQYGGWGDAYWLANGKPSGWVANPFNPQTALWATTAYIASLYHSTGSWESALEGYSGNNPSYYAEANASYQQIESCG